jgi:aryl-alcohol dehydrogenase-like predicted oxidoreductase
MEYSSLGRTGLSVSKLALGTAAFGLENYGIHEPGERSRLCEDQAVGLVRAAVEKGINFFDTARGYGESEAVLGKCLSDSGSCIIATKVSIFSAESSAAAAKRTTMDSIETSLKALCRDVLDVVQIHNATQDILERGEILDVLERAREAGKLKFVGASVYGEPAALAAIRCGRVDVLQIALNLLDQRMLARVLPEARKSNVGVVARSAFLKGALTDRAQLLPDGLRSLAEASDRMREGIGQTWESLPGAALRFCLSVPGVHSVLVGLRSLPELAAALAAQNAGPLDSAVLRKTDLLKLNDDQLLDPSYWPQV